MSEEETFDIYGDVDGDSISRSSPSQQSGPKKRLRRERSSSAPPLISPLDGGESDGASTPRQKKVKEDDEKSVNGDNSNGIVEVEEDPFREYDNHVSIYTFGAPSIMRHLFFVFETDVWCSIIMLMLLIMARLFPHLNNLLNLLPLKEKFLFLIKMLLLHYTSVTSIGYRSQSIWSLMRIVVK